MSRTLSRSSPFRLLLAAPIALMLGLSLSACGKSEPPPLAGASIGGPFTLSDKAGRAVHWSDFTGKWRIVYFGYTFCPDVCPLDVAAMTRGLATFAKQEPGLAAQIQPIFITIDPERDTPARVGEFAAAFSPGLVGLTGTPAQIAAAAKAFSAFYGRGKDMPGGGYIMEHSRIAYLMDRQGQPVAMLPVDQGPAAVAAELDQWVR
ncbi:MAG: SCO family protein [Novosphingobium sp.]